MQKTFMILALSALCAGTLAAGGPAPEWVERTITVSGDYVYVTGMSQPQPDEQLARSEAVANATKEFVRYCRVDVTSVDRNSESYTVSGKKECSTVDAGSQSSFVAHAAVSGAVPDDWYVRREGGKYIASVLLKVPKSEFDRIAKENPVKLSLDVLFYYENAEGKLQALDDGGVLRSGDGYALYVKPGGPCYLYVYQVDSLGKAFRLFPNERWKTGKNPLPAGADCWLPNGRNVFVLDETTGKESFYLFASPDAIPEFEDEGSVRITKKDMDSVAKLKKMGVAGVQERKDAALVSAPGRKDVVQIKKRLQADGAFVHETWYWHQ